MVYSKLVSGGVLAALGFCAAPRWLFAVH